MDKKDREIEVLRDTLQFIIDIGFDYDGYENSLDGCKKLIDEIVYTSKEALNGRGITYVMPDGNIVNVFDEVVGEYNSCEQIKYFDKNRRDY